MTKPFVINRHGRLVFPCNVFPALDFDLLAGAADLDVIVRREIETKAPGGADLLARCERGHATRGRLLRDLSMHLVLAERYALTMYDARPVRMRDLPRGREDVFLPVLRPWEGRAAVVEAVVEAWGALPAEHDEASEQRIFAVLIGLLAGLQAPAEDARPLLPTVDEALADPAHLVPALTRHDPHHRVFGERAIIDHHEAHAELEAPARLAMVLADRRPWDPAAAGLSPVAALDDDAFVLVEEPRDRAVAAFVRRCREGAVRRPRPASAPAPEPGPPPTAPIVVPHRCDVLPRIASLAVARGELLCTNEDVVRNAALSWSPMTAGEITEKTGIESRVYSELELVDLALIAAHRALAGAEREASEIAAVIFCSCTSTQVMPSVATWLAAELGTYQTHTSFDLIAACAGFPYGLAEAVRLLQDIQAPVLMVMGEKFSDKIGTVRPSRMIFGDGAAAVVVTPAPAGEPGDVEVFQTYAGGPRSEVNSINWPNPAFDNDITVWGPEVRTMVARFLEQMMDELGAMEVPDEPGLRMLDAIELIVPHQANRTLVEECAAAAGMPLERLYFNIGAVGNVSAASIPLAMHDAVMEGRVQRPARVFTPGFGAGAAAGYSIIRLDPSIVVPEPGAVMAGAERTGVPV
ncbi:MAG: 3-oxoacyl-[acyl-carrier-protein] synthase III C-terminal domain-containing protein [Miltoncostaeaceae bacterium]